MNQTISSSLLMARILWAAMTASYPLLLLVTIALPASSPDALAPQFARELQYVFPALFLAAVASGWAFRRLFRKRGGRPAAHFASHNTFSQEALNGASQKIVISLVVSLALHEAGVLLGFVLAMHVRDWSVMLPYVSAGLVANAALFPRATHLLEAVRAEETKRS